MLLHFNKPRLVHSSQSGNSNAIHGLPRANMPYCSWLSWSGAVSQPDSRIRQVTHCDMLRTSQVEVTLYLVSSAALGGYLVSAALFVMSGSC